MCEMEGHGRFMPLHVDPLTSHSCLLTLVQARDVLLEEGQEVETGTNELG